MRALGLRERTGGRPAGEDSGLLFPLSRWSIYSETSVPMGTRSLVTPAAAGRRDVGDRQRRNLYKPYVVRRVASTDGTLLVDRGPQVVRRVIGTKASKEMIEILKGVVKEGTGKKAAVEGVDVAGKTGTSQKIDPKNQAVHHEKYIASFVGFAPADDAKLCIAVVLDEPRADRTTAARSAAPVVGNILRRRALVFAK